jgi:hypothetical protein
MEKITAAKFYNMLERDPSIFQHWNTPLEITQYVDCENSEITHLSKHLVFSGLNENEDSANFTDCKSLTVATGTFSKYAVFSGSSIQRIENLTVCKPDKNGNAANFYSCKNLEIATGIYPGAVNFSWSGIHTIQNLHIENPDQDGDYTAFYQCPNLHNLNGWDITKKFFIESGKLEAEIKRRAALQKFHKENQIEALPFL